MNVVCTFGFDKNIVVIFLTQFLVRWGQPRGGVKIMDQ